MALLGNLKGSAHAFPETDFYNSVATQSLRFNDDDNAYLSKTFGSGNQRTWTWSGWVKRNSLTSHGDFLYSQVTNGSDTSWFYFNASDQLNMQSYEGANQVDIKTNAKFRDVSAWYHVMAVLDTTQSTNTDRAKMYVNGELQTSLASTTYPSENADLKIGSGDAPFLIGGSPDSYGTGADYKSDMYYAEVNFVDGIALDPTYFGETKNGVWVPKIYNGSYGTNGFRLQFKQTGTGTASASTIGADTSGNDNHFTSTNLVASDSNIPDCPENNFATINSISSGAGVFSDGNLKYVSTSDTGDGTLGISSGKFYAEVYVNAGSNSYIGVHDISDLSPTRGGNFTSHGAIAYKQNGDQYSLPVGGSSATASYGATYTSGDIISIAVDVDGDTVTFYKNGSSQGNTTNGVSHISTGGFYSLIVYGNTFTVNFGQDSSFLGVKTAQGNTDDNDIGDFYYAPPSGFLALCSANLPKPTIGPDSATQADDHFNILIYDGNDDATRTFDVGFVSDFSWFKARNASGIGHQLYDSSRGVQKYLASNTNDDEATNTEGVTSFNSSGLLAIGNSNFLNKSGRTHVLWNWKANGGTTTTNDASATSVGSIDSVIQANTTAGFSIVTFASNNTAGNTVAHGLGVAPKMIITKGRTQESSWYTYHYNIGAGNYLTLNGNGASASSSGLWGNTHPTSTVFTIGTNDAGYNDGTANGSLAYCFADVEGYSKFGSYTGNGNANGTFVYTGFAVKYVMIKNTARAADWRINDTTRQPSNDEGGHLLLSNSNSAEITNEYDIDFLSNGFKLRSGDVYENGSGEAFIYMAFAEAPFKYANAR